MRAFHGLSIRRKLTLILMTTSSVALVLASSALGVYDRHAFWRATVYDLTAVADFIGSNSTAALTFNDPAAARETLAALAAKKYIYSACIYTSDGHAFATYLRGQPGATFAPPVVQDDSTHFAHGQLILFRRILLHDEKIGTVYLQSDLADMRERRNRYLAVIAFIMLGSLFVVLLLASRLQRAISEPIRSLAWTTKMVSIEKNYSIRAVKQSDDELGLLIEGFNGMLAQIQSRDAALLKAQDELEDRVQKRTEELQQEITERKRAEETLTKLSSALQQSADMVVITDKDGVIEYVNPAFEKETGYTKNEAVGRTPRILKSGRQEQEFYEALWRTILSGEVYRGVFENKKEDGALYYEEKTIAPLIDTRGNITHFVAVGRDITARKQAEEELQRAKETAEAASRAKSEFLANMSHEIRTPMNGILGMTELALDTELTPEQQEYLTTVKTSADHLLRVINDILDFSKIEAGKLDLELVEFPLRETLGETLRTLAVRAHRKDIELSCWVSGDVPDALVGDPGRLRQVLVNLVGNAIKFTERGEVLVRVEADSQTDGVTLLHFGVKDTGIGIPPEKLAQIFEPFAQADSSRTRRFGGTGLGLSISTRLVEMMGGRIWVESEPSHGTTFHFTVAFGQPVISAARPLPLEPESLESLPVLVVDDNETNRRILEEMLTNWRMAPESAEGARAALKAMERAQSAGRPFPLILLDAQMPEMDGFALAEQIQRNPGLARATIMMLTSDRRDGDAARCLKLGITACLTKPITQSELFDAILLALGNRSQALQPVQPTAVTPLGPAGRALRILLAEDNSVNRRLAVRLLEKRGHSVVVVNNGREALEALERASFSEFEVVLMDVQMPEMDGMEATAAIRTREKAHGAHVPIIAMTAHAMKGDREKCLEAGMDGYVSKPVRAVDLFAEIEKHVRHAAAPPAAAGSAEPASGEILDRDVLLARVEGDKELLTEMVELFLQDSPRLIAAIRKAAARGDAKSLERSAHTLKGSVSNFCASAAAAAALRLEQMGREGDLAQAAEGCAALEKEIARLKPLLAELGQEVAR